MSDPDIHLCGCCDQPLEEWETCAGVCEWCAAEEIPLQIGRGEFEPKETAMTTNTETRQMTKPRPEYSEHSQFKLLQIMPAEGTLAIYKRDGEPDIDECESDLWAIKLDMLGLAVVTTREYATTWDEAGKPTRLEYQKDVVNRVVGVCLGDGFFDVCETAGNFVCYFNPDPRTSPDKQRQEISEMVCWKPGQKVTVSLPDDTNPVLVTCRE